MVPLIAEINPTVLFIAGLMLVVGVVLRWSRRKAKQQRKSSSSAVSRIDSAGARTAQASPAIAPQELGRWEVQMHELSRDLSGQLDTKIRIVQQLVLRAEDQTARLEAALQRAEQLLEQIQEKH